MGSEGLVSPFARAEKAYAAFWLPGRCLTQNRLLQSGVRPLPLASMDCPSEPDSGLLAELRRREPHMSPRRLVRGLAQALVVTSLATTAIAGSAPSGPAGGEMAAPASPDADARAHWAFRPLPLAADAPQERAAGQGRPAEAGRWIDRYFAEQHAKRGLQALPPADRATWLRRATYDLTGLPPTPKEIADFLADESPGARERVIERLLASPAYGERWGRHWLDVARYADTAGDAGDFPIPEAWRYRNWVVEAIAADMPYDQFILRQIAGDLLPAKTQEERNANLIATGYLALSKRFGQNPRDFVHTLDDTLDNLGKAFLGLTVSCARCHDHKFDPIPMEDYYALYGFFESTTYTFPGLEHRQDSANQVPLGSMEEQALWQAYLECLRQLEGILESIQKDKTLEDKERQSREKALAAVLKQLKANPPSVPLAFAVSEGKAADTRLRPRGDFADQSGKPVRRGFLQVLGGQTLPEDVAGSGRLHLANWIIQKDNPLTPRVMVNRLWLHHFGRPLVSTPDDFGLRSQTPEHLALLDWLAAEFVTRGWSLKAMHRLLMSTETYGRASLPETRETSAALAAAQTADSANLSYWRFESRRLSAEELRDSLLAISGRLDPEPGGRHPFPAPLHFNYSQHRPFSENYDSDKRSLYLMQRRLEKHPYLGLFDGADPTAATGLRPLTVSPMQALFHLNSEFTDVQAQALAQRLLEEESSSPEDRVESIWMRVYGRPPGPEEASLALAFLEQVRPTWAQHEAASSELAAWTSLARTLFSSNAFVFVR